MGNKLWPQYVSSLLFVTLFVIPIVTLGSTDQMMIRQQHRSQSVPRWLPGSPRSEQILPPGQTCMHIKRKQGGVLGIGYFITNVSLKGLLPLTLQAAQGPQHQRAKRCTGRGLPAEVSHRWCLSACCGHNAPPISFRRPQSSHAP